MEKKKRSAFGKDRFMKHLGKTKMEKLISSFLFFFVFLLPWQTRWIFAEYSNQVPYYGGLSLYFTDILFLMLCCLWAVWLVQGKSYKRLFSHKKHRFFFSLMAVFILYAVMSLFWSVNPELRAWNALRLLQAGLFVFILATFPIRKRLLFLALLGAGVIQSLLAISQFFLQEIQANTLLGIACQDPREAGVSVVEYLDQRWLRAYGGFPHPNILGAFLSLSALIASAWFYDVYLQMRALFKRWEEVTLEEVKPIRLQIIVSLSSFVLVLIGLLLTFSRTAWMGFAVAWVFLTLFLLQSAKQKEAKKLILVSGVKQVIAGALVLGALTLIFGSLWTMRIHDSSRTGVLSVNERQQLVEEAKGVIQQDVIKGHGIGSYVSVIRENIPGKEAYAYQPVHNVWMLLWAELGVIGFLPYGGFLLLLFFCFSVILKKRSVTLSQAIVLSGILSICIMAYYEHFWWSLSFGLLLASLFIGLSFPLPFTWRDKGEHRH